MGHKKRSSTLPPPIPPHVMCKAIERTVVAKLGREQTEALLAELALDRNDTNSWKTLESLAMWV